MFALEETQIQVAGLLKRHDMQFARVLQVHHLVADIICRFHQIHQRITRVFVRVVRIATDAKIRCNALVQRFVFLEKPELLLAFGAKLAGIGVFDDRSQSGVGQRKTALATTVKTVSQQTKRIGVALKRHKVGPLLVGEQLTHTLTFALGEICADGFLAGVTERRVAHIMRQACRRHNTAYLLKGRTRVGVFLPQTPCHFAAQRTPDGTHLQRMSKPVVHEDTPRQRKYLRLVLKPAKRRRENQTVIVALKLRTHVLFVRMVLLKTQSLSRK